MHKLKSFVFAFFLFCLTEMCKAEKVHPIKIFVEGGESSIINESEAMIKITFHDIIPYFQISDGNISELLPIKNLINFVDPMNSLYILADRENKNIFLVEISNISLSDGNDTLSFNAKPQKYFDGELFKSFNDEIKEGLPILSESNKKSAHYIEYLVKPMNNSCMDSFHVQVLDGFASLSPNVLKRIEKLTLIDE